MSQKYRSLAPLVGELAEIFDFSLRGQKSSLSVTAFAVTPLPKGEASLSKNPCFQKQKTGVL